MIKAVIFDCFGVLITDALQVLCDEFRLVNPSGADEVKDLVRMANRGLIDPADSNARIAELFGLDIAAYRQKIIAGEVKNMALFEYILQIRTLHKTAVLSNISASGLSRRFSTEEIERHFDTVVASGEIGYAKPEAEAYEIAADRLQVRLDECIFTDDREDYCAGAVAVGMQAILYKDFAQFKTELEALLANA